MDLLVKNTDYFFEVYFNFIMAEWLPVFTVLIVMSCIWIVYRRNDSLRKYLVLLHAIYGAVVLGITLFHWGRVGTQALLLNPLIQFKELFSENKVHIIRAVTSNICLFMPIGFFTGMRMRKRNVRHAVIVGAAFSASIEILQYICHRGTLETLDFVCNVFGAWFGVVFMKLINQIWRKMKCLYLLIKR